SFFSHSSRAHIHLLSFPTRRSSDLIIDGLNLKFRQDLEPRICSHEACLHLQRWRQTHLSPPVSAKTGRRLGRPRIGSKAPILGRSEEHTSELQSLAYLVCRLLLEKK